MILYLYPDFDPYYQNMDPDPATQMNTDPSGSGIVATIVRTNMNYNIEKTTVPNY
jgi:hypothetical protein